MQALKVNFLDYPWVMDIHELRRQNVLSLIERRFSGRRSDFATASKVSPTYVSRMLKAGGDDRKRIGEDLARKIEDELGLPQGILDRPSAEESTNVYGVAQDMSRSQPIVISPGTPKISWRDVVFDTPERFALEVADDAMAPQISKGDVVHFAKLKAGERPRPGRVVLVADKSDRAYIRFFEDRGDEFIAKPQPHSGYSPLEEKRDGLRVIALWMGYYWED